MADKKLADGEIQEQRRECLCKLTKFVGAAGVAAAVWPLVSALSPDEKTLGKMNRLMFLLRVLLLDKPSGAYGRES